MEHIGIDVHKNQSQICILTEADEMSGSEVGVRIRTKRKCFEEVFGERPKAKVVIEASTESEWVARCLEELGHEVIVADPNYAPMYAHRSRRIKTDRRMRELWRRPAGWELTGQRIGRLTNSDMYEGCFRCGRRWFVHGFGTSVWCVHC